MNERIRELAFQSAGGLVRFDERGFMLYEDEVEKFAELVRADEREAVLETVEALTGMESDRHKMFSEGYDHALYHIRQLVEGRSKK